MKVLLSLFLIILINQTQANCLNAGVINVAPYGFASEQGQIQGIHWDYLAAISKESGICINKKLLPYKRAWQNLEEGVSDISIISATLGRKAFINPIAQMSKVRIVVIPHKGIKINHYHNLESLIIGKMRGTQLNAKFDTDPNIKKVSLNNYLQAHDMLSKDRIDAIAGSEAGILYFYSQHASNKHMDINEQYLLEERERWLHMTKQSEYQNLIPVLEKAVIKLQKSGTFDAIKQYYIQ